VFYTLLSFRYGCFATLIGPLGGTGCIYFLLLLVMFDFRFCFGHIVKDASHFLYRRNNEHMI